MEDSTLSNHLINTLCEIKPGWTNDLREVFAALDAYDDASLRRLRHDAWPTRLRQHETQRLLRKELVFHAHRLLCHSTLGSRLIKLKRDHDAWPTR